MDDFQIEERRRYCPKRSGLMIAGKPADPAVHATCYLCGKWFFGECLGAEHDFISRGQTDEFGNPVKGKTLFTVEVTRTISMVAYLNIFAASKSEAEDAVKEQLDEDHDWFDWDSDIEDTNIDVAAAKGTSIGRYEVDDHGEIVRAGQ